MTVDMFLRLRDARWFLVVPTGLVAQARSANSVAKIQVKTCSRILVCAGNLHSASFVPAPGGIIRFMISRK